MQRAILERGLIVNKLTRRVRLTVSGYSDVEEHLERCHVKRGGLKHLPLVLDADRPQYVRGLDLMRDQTHGSHEALRFCRLDSNAHPRRVREKIRFGTTLTPEHGPFDVAYTYRLMNGHATNADEILRKYAKADAWEYASVECTGAVDSLQLKVEFPSDALFQAVDRVGAEAHYQPDSMANR